MSTQSEGMAEESKGTGKESIRERLRFWLDMAVKLTVPLGAIAGIWLAHSFDAQQSVRQIANQREQSESGLRATMFGNLIGPIVGPLKDGQTVDPVRYALMVQLLALNFHEHFEFRPLMEHADRLLAQSALGDKTERRLALRTISHRIIDRQIASLSEDSFPSCTPQGQTQVTFWLFSADQDEGLVEDYRKQWGEDRVWWLKPNQGMSVRVAAPNCKDTLDITFSEPDWSSGRVKVGIVRTATQHAAGGDPQSGANGGGAGSSGSQGDAFQFTLSPFSFPFTDNTPLIDGNRFALFIRDESSASPDGNGQFLWKVQLRWFPERYYAVTERPVNYEVVRSVLGIVPSKGVKH